MGLIIPNVLVLAAAIPLVQFRNPAVSALLVMVIGLGFRSALPLLEAVTTIAIGTTGNYGKIRTAGSLSFILGTLFFQSALVLPLDNALNIALWMTLTAAAAAVTMVFIPERYETGGGRNRAVKGTGPARPKRSLWSPALIVGLIIMALNRFGMSSIYGFFSLYLVESIRWNAVGFMWALASAAEVPFMFLSRRIIARFGAFNCVSIATGALVLRLLIYALLPVKGGIILAQLLHSLCFGLFHAASIAFISGAVPPERRALGMTLYLSLGSGLPTFLGNILGGFIVEHAGYRALFGSFAVFPLIAVGIYAAAVIQQKRGTGDGRSL
jgi:PPP family 3-phenylpropionic acid transporter